MTVHLTAAQARKLGIDTKTKMRVRKTVKGAPYHTVCMTCGLSFHVESNETEHVENTKHANYRLVFGL